jgi:hypothetical protein
MRRNDRMRIGRDNAVADSYREHRHRCYHAFTFDFLEPMLLMAPTVPFLR